MRAILRIEQRNSEGGLIAVRQTHNSVLRSGAELLARAFSGQPGGITHMAVGTSDAPETEAFATVSLADQAEVALPPEAFTVDPPDPVKRVVRVRVRGTVAAADAVGTLREAALIFRSGDTITLYNRVVFAPIEKGSDHELTLFWEVGFPYGDLQWLL
jgi:hypothetical protein